MPPVPPEPVDPKENMPGTLEKIDAKLEDLQDLVADPDEAADALPQDEQEAYREAQQSVVDARRKAETYEGSLQVS